MTEKPQPQEVCLTVATVQGLLFVAALRFILGAEFERASAEDKSPRVPETPGKN